MREQDSSMSYYNQPEWAGSAQQVATIKTNFEAANREKQAFRELSKDELRLIEREITRLNNLVNNVGREMINDSDFGGKGAYVTNQSSINSSHVQELQKILDHNNSSYPKKPSLLSTVKARFRK
jgi:hypothetical protein